MELEFRDYIITDKIIRSFYSDSAPRINETIHFVDLYGDKYFFVVRITNSYEIVPYNPVSAKKIIFIREKYEKER